VSIHELQFVYIVKKLAISHKRIKFTSMSSGEPQSTIIAVQGSTGTTWAKHNPDQAAKALLLFADGESLRTIAAETGAAIRTIQGYLRQQGVWNACAKTIAQTARVALKQMTDRLVSETDDIALDQLPQAMKTAADIAASLDGTPQTIIEHRHTHSIAEPTVDAIRAFKARMQPTAIIEAETIPDAPEPIATPLPPQPAWEPGEMV